MCPSSTRPASATSSRRASCRDLLRSVKALTPRFAAALGVAFTAAFAAAGVGAYAIVASSSPAHLTTRPNPAPHRGGPLPRAGAVVPAYDLWSDPVFPTLRIGYAIERHLTPAGPSEALARSEDGGRVWRLIGAFPFANGYSDVQFVSPQRGYAFGPAGVAVTDDGGRSFVAGKDLGGELERVVPIGADVWATYAVCHGPPVASTRCGVRLAVSHDGGLTFSPSPRRAPIEESFLGGDVLARVTLDEAYVVSYGPTGGGLARTADDGASWVRLPDPCSAWRTVDMAALWAGQLWMICGGTAVRHEDASAKAVFRSDDGGTRWTAVAYTGLGPERGPLASSPPFGELWYAGQLSELATISPERAWIGVDGVGVLVTLDGGRTWKHVLGMADDGMAAGVGVTFNDARHGWAIEFREGVYRTDDAIHWVLVDGR